MSSMTSRREDASSVKSKKRIKQDAALVVDLNSTGNQRHRALEICVLQLPGTTLAAGLWTQARAAMSPFPLSKEDDELSAAQGVFLLLKSGWSQPHISQDIVAFARRVMESKHTAWETKWYALHAAASVLRLDEFDARSLFRTFGFLPWYRQPTLVERLRGDIAKREQWLDVEDGEENEEEVIVTDDIANVHGILVPRQKGSEQQVDASLHPPTSQANLRNVALALLTTAPHVPIVLNGEPGSGKTWTIRTLARMCNKELIELQLDDQADSKTLLGSMTCVRGTFAWMPGALTRAVREGKWVLIEDIDACPAEIVASLKPLFQNGSLSLPNRSNSFDLHASPGFRLFGTTRKGDFVLHRCSGNVAVESLSKEELVWVCNHRFPELAAQVVEMVVENHFALYQADPTISAAQKIRDLFKWFNRIVAFCHSIATQSRSSEFLTEKMRTSIVLEGVDVVTARMPSPEARVAFARNLAIRWGLTPDLGEGLVRSRRPDFAFDSDSKTWRAGRIILSFPRNGVPKEFKESFAPTSVSLKTLEQVASCAFLNEPCLLVGETGAGKTSMLQLLAKCCGKTLVVQNMHVQSDSTEFLGGFKPTPSLRQEANALHTEFHTLFQASFDAKENEKFLNAVLGYCEEGKWKKLCKALEAACAKYASAVKEDGDGEGGNKRVKREHDAAWAKLFQSVEAFKIKSQSKDLFTFVEGVLIRALRNGDWILLDEVNLASGETLERLLPLLEDSRSSLSLTERGDVEQIPRHPQFRLFAAMNPSTDFGKKNLPPALRSRFTEIYVDEATEESDIRLVVERFLGQDARDLVEPAVSAFIRARELSKSTLVDGNGQAPRYSLRTLVRTLHAARSLATTQRFGMKRALLESFLALFTTSLEPASCAFLTQEIAKRIWGGDKVPSSFPASKPPSGTAKESKILVCENSYWLDKGKEEVETDEGTKFVSTPHVDAKLKLVARAVALKRYPILLQGPTSAGKTSLIAHLARITGNKFVRINNHEHTDLEEYLGSYVADDSGKLVFHYGSLVEAVMKGYWIVLDELNLAPSDVLEALNRLLDDNRELFLAETQETIVPHPNFILFATQNPPGGAYGGRKQLSKAFRNRFLEVHLDDIPHSELETILEKRNRLPESFSRAMVNVMKELQIVRSKSHLFAGKAGLITPRDLMRWADRDPRSYQELAEEGYRLLGERLRSAEERLEVQQVIEKFCRAKINFNDLYQVPLSIKDDLVWTESMRRLFSLVHACALKQEPCLIVGETGLGKTRCVQAVSKTFGTELVVLNCHQNTETADILGSLRPMRYRSEIAVRLKELQAAYDAKSIQELIEKPSVPPEVKDEIASLVGKSLKLFEWADGPLVECMRKGEFFLLDEISLADDAVLERLNSVLETGRTLTLAERGGQVVEVLKAHDAFRAFATMNPGGDFGKRELSPALRNRFTEIWLPGISDFNDFRMVVEEVFLHHGATSVIAQRLAEEMVRFTRWFNHACESKHQNFAPLSMRDLIAWAEFISETGLVGKALHDEEELRMLFAHGCFLTCLDGLGVGSGFGGVESKKQFLADCRQAFPEVFAFEKGTASSGEIPMVDTETQFGVAPFVVSKEQAVSSLSSGSFEFNAPTTRLNLIRLLRAMQLKRAILLEGSPGVGKTTIVSALARALGKKLVRINLSEQTDFSDLVGSDLPLPSSDYGQGEKMEFQWSDGVFLQALKNGDWVLLDELNLASQSVLEGLNSVLDHRASVFVPELNRTFPCSPNFRVFACQNPLQQGGGRKGLPKSFLNRFTKVYVEALDEEDYLKIAARVFPSVADLPSIIRVTKLMHQMVSSSSSEGGEFNLRDVFRFCEMRKLYKSPKVIFDLLYASRYGLDAAPCDAMFTEAFGKETGNGNFDWFRVEPAEGYGVVFGNEDEGALERLRGKTKYVPILGGSFPSSLSPMLVRVAHCVKQSYPVLLVGESGAGKSLVVQELAGILGQKLHVFQMTSGTDSTELLGCFEQTDFQQNKLDLLLKLANGIELWQVDEMSDLERLAQLEERRSELAEAAQELLAGGTRYNADDLDKVFQNGLETLGSTLDELRSALAHDWERTKQDSAVGRSGGGFRWVDGTLIRAMEAGEWIVLDDANLCSPTVLDRLNSLLEPGGELMVNEQGTTLEGGLRIVKPHKDFRIFLTIDPRFGLVSRAMRNRCVELYFHPEIYELTERDRMVLLEEDLGLKRQCLENDVDTKDVLAVAMKTAREAELRRRPLNDVWVARTGPLSLGVGRDLQRDRFANRVRLASRVLSLLKTMPKGTMPLRSELKAALRGDALQGVELATSLVVDGLPVKKVTLVTILLTVAETLEPEERDWIRMSVPSNSAHAENEIDSVFLRQLIEVLVGDHQFTKTERNAKLESLSLVDDEVLPVPARFLKETFDSLTAWTIALERSPSHAQDDALMWELLHARDDFWRAAMSSSSSHHVSSVKKPGKVESREPLNICWRRLLKRISALKVSLSSVTAEWVHFENVAKRFDAALKRPCWEELMISTTASATEKKKKTSVWKSIDSPRPPTDLTAFEGRNKLVAMCEEELLHVSASRDEEGAQNPTAMKRGEQWRRSTLSALCSLRFAGSGGGVGRPFHVDQKEIASLRDEAIAAMTSQTNVTPLDRQEFPQVLILSERVVSLLELKVRQRVAWIAALDDKDATLDTQAEEALRSDARKVIEFALKTNCKPLWQLAPYQELVWASEGKANKDLRSTCRALLHELIISAEELEWQGQSRNFVTRLVSSLLPPDDISGHRRAQEKKHVKEWDIKCESLAGQNTLTLATNSLIRGSGLGVDLLASKPESSACVCLSSPVSLKERELKAAQLNSAANALKAFQFAATTDLDWQLLLWTFKLTKEAMMDDKSARLSQALQRCGEIIQRNEKANVGVAWALLGAVRYTCLAPETKLDPQCKARISVEVLKRRKLVFEDRIAALRLNRYWATGSREDDEQIRLLEHRLKDVEEQVKDLEMCGIAVEREAEFERCFDEIQSFIRTVGVPERVLDLVDAHGAGRDAKSAEMFLTVCATFCSRMRREFPSCCDVIDPFVSSLYLTMHGLQEMLLRKKSIRYNNGSDGLLLRLFAWPRCHSENLPTVTSSIGPKFNTKMVLAALPALELVKRESTNRRLSSIHHSRLHDAFLALTMQWRTDRKEEERKRLEREASVKVKKAKETKDGDDKQLVMDPKDQKDFKKMFPDFHSEFALKPKYDDEDMGEDERPFHAGADRVDDGDKDDDDEEEDDDSYQALNPDQVESLVGSFISLYGRSAKKEGDSDELRLQAFTRGFDVGSDLVSAVPLLGDADRDQALLASNIFALGSCISDLRM